MSIWGHDVVHVEKDSVKQEWRVFTAKHPRQLLLTIPWMDAFKEIKHAPDYLEALRTCQSHEETRLTRSEARRVQEGMRSTSPTTELTQTEKRGDNVVSLADFKKRRR